MKRLRKTLVISSVARNDYAMKKTLRSFGGTKIIIVHTDPYSIDNDDEMKERISENLENIERYLGMEHEEMIVDIYDFYGNARKFRQLLDNYKDFKIVIDVTGGDKCVTDALVYASMITKADDVSVVYFKREADAGDLPTEHQYILYPRVPVLSDRQKDFMYHLGDGLSMEEMANKLGTVKSNAYYLAKTLSSMGLVISDGGHAKPAYPSNIYSPVSGDEQDE